MLERSTFKNIGEAVLLFLAWTFIAHGIFVFLLTWACAFAVYGFRAAPAVELAASTTALSFFFSTPFFLVFLVKPSFDKNGRWGSYLIIGYPAGAVFVLLYTLFQLINQFWLKTTGVPKQAMPPAWTGGIGIAFVAVMTALILSRILTKNDNAKDYLD